MPELPDVEIFRRYLSSTALHQQIEGITVSTDKILEKGTSRQLLGRRLKRRQLTGTLRHGKNLYVETDGSGWLYYHFGMTGRLRYFRNIPADLNHVRFILTFDNGYQLAFINQRLLGKIGWVEVLEESLAEKNLGPDAMALNRGDFETILDERRGSIKSTLMDQQLLAGIGNIYADEILFQAGIHPETQVSTLTRDEQRRLFAVMRGVLLTAVKRKADVSRFPADWLLPNRTPGSFCPRCGDTFSKKKITGRTSFFCATCQPE